MQIDDIKHKELTPSEYEVLSRDGRAGSGWAPAAISMTGSPISRG